MDILNFSKKSGIPPEIVEAAVRLSIEEVFKKTYGIPVASYCFETNTVDTVYRVPSDIYPEQAQIMDESAIEGDVFFKEIPIENFPPEFFSITKHVFAKKLSVFEEEAKIELWSKKIHGIMDGEILSVDSDSITFQVGHEYGVMKKENWIDSEHNLYKKGAILKVYISKITSRPFKIYLSRKSPHLPVLLFKSRMPLYTFKLIKRYPGKITFIKSNIIFNQQVIKIHKEIISELNNETIRIIPLNKK